MSNSILARFEHKVYIGIKRMRLKNKAPSIISSNCNGGVILHDLGLKFNTPTINLYFDPEDFLKFLSDIDDYLGYELIEVESKFRFPVGKLNDIIIYFMHYNSFQEAKEKWVERAHRIDKNNLFIIMTDNNGCTYEQVVMFDKLPYKNKVILTNRNYKDISSAVYMKSFEYDQDVGILSDWKPGFWKRRWIDDFDYVSFLNQKGV